MTGETEPPILSLERICRLGERLLELLPERQTIRGGAEVLDELLYDAPPSDMDRWHD